MALVENELGITHKIDMDGIAVFGASAAESDAIAEEDGKQIEVIHLDLGRRALYGISADLSFNSDK